MSTEINTLVAQAKKFQWLGR